MTLEVSISVEGYADDIYILEVCAASLAVMLEATHCWLLLTVQAHCEEVAQLCRAATGTG